MRTALDSNIISAFWSSEPLVSRITAKLRVVRGEGGLVICGVVYAELSAYPAATNEFLESFLRDAGVEADFELGAEVWREAGRRFAAYAKRRRASRGGHAKRLLADFIIGSHALLAADRLLTLDPERYARDFPELRLISTSAD